MKYLLGIDNGGTFSKAALFDENGKQIAVVSKQTDLITPKSGYTERNMLDLWEANAYCIRELIIESKVKPEKIAGVSFSGHGKGLYMVEENGFPSYNGIISTDARAWEFVKKWNDNGTSEKVFQKTYQEILACQPVSILAWFKEHKPEILEKTKWIFAVKDYIRFMLTGEAYAEYTDFSGANLINMTTGNYDEELLSYFGLADIMDKLPPLKNSADVCGYVTKKASEETLLPVGIPVAGGMFDIDACAIASGLDEPKQLCMIAGTWSINEYIAEKPIVNKSVALNSMFCIPGYFLIEESSPTSAGNFEWFVQNLMNSEKEYSKKFGISVYQLADRMVNEIDPKDSNVIFLPFLNGSNEDPLAKGTFIGLTAYHKKVHLMRAVFEGVVFSHVTHVNKLFKNREKPDTIRISGGAAKSDVWVQIFADALQIPIDVIEDKELGAQGAAIAAGIAAKIYKDYKDGIKKTVKITKTIYPRKEYKEIYQEKYKTYRTVVDSLGAAWDRFKND